MKCVECGNETDLNSGTQENPLCPSCYNKMSIQYSNQNKIVDDNKDELKCQKCGGSMHKTNKINSSISIQIAGLILFIVGIILLFVFPIGTLVGIVIMILSAKMGYKRIKVWKCKNCGYFFERD